MRLLKHLISMNFDPRLPIGRLLKTGAVLIAVNEIRGMILAGPVLYGLYKSDGSLMVISIGVCSLGGIALSVIIPLIAAKKIKKYAAARLGKRLANA
jgi:hypothetical protein